MERQEDGSSKHALLINDDHESSSEMTEAQPIETETESQEDSRCATCFWVSCGLGAGFCMGTGGAIYATEYAKYGLSGVSITGPGTFLVFLVWRILLELRHRFMHGKWIKSEESRMVDNDGYYKWKNLIPLLGNVFINGMYLIIMSFASQFVCTVQSRTNLILIQCDEV